MSLPRRARLVAVFWVIAVIVVWNAVFDRVIVLAGRQYIQAAVAADAAGRSLRIDDWMQPAVVRAFWLATAIGLAVAILGVASVFHSVRRSDRANTASKSAV
jgi:hypothetical protein